MEATTAPDISKAELEISGKDFDAFRQMMEDTVLDSDLVRIDWLLERIGLCEEEMAENNLVADRRIAMQEDFRQGENAKLQRKISWLTGEIGQIAPPSADKMLAEHGKKSRVLGHGKFGYKIVTGERIEITDMDKVVEFARCENIPVDTVHTVSKTELKLYARSTGAGEGDGWELHPSMDGFYVKAAK